MMNTDSTTNSVRQILMNELGLTRDSVREEMMKIIEQVVERKVNSLINEKTFQDLIRKQFERLICSDRYDEQKMKEMVMSHLSKQVTDFMKDHVTINVKKD